MLNGFCLEHTKFKHSHNVSALILIGIVYSYYIC